MKDSSSLRLPGRCVVIVTTASLPWRTGTAVNPLLRAAYTAEILKESKVILMLPWLAKSEQKQIFPEGITFSEPKEQERWVRSWVDKRTGFKSKFEIKFYPARYDGEGFFSIFPVGDLTESISEEEADVAILEEPEHLTWFHHGRRWTTKFRHVVGIMHTNYVDYIRRESPAAARAIFYVNRRVCSIHCHKVIKLSDAVQALPRSSTCFCHGVPKAFREVGQKMQPHADTEACEASPSKLNGQEEAETDTDPTPSGEGHVKADTEADGAKSQEGKGSGSKITTFSKGAYFLGKGVWGKGYTELLSLLAKHQHDGGKPLPVDVYGSGEDMQAIKKQAKEDGLAITFHSGIDHLDEAIHPYRAFVNPSTSDVVATTSAEALAMGKWVICARHPSNTWFEENFGNVLVYDSPEEFSEKLSYAEEHDPQPLSEEEVTKLTWEDATQRFLDAAEIKSNEWPGRLTGIKDGLSWPVINAGTGIEAVRRVIGAGRNTARTPKDLLNFDPANSDLEYDYHLALGYGEPRLL